jgi:hypothetical protein
LFHKHRVAYNSSIPYTVLSKPSELRTRIRRADADRAYVKRFVYDVQSGEDGYYDANADCDGVRNQLYLCATMTPNTTVPSNKPDSLPITQSEALLEIAWPRWEWVLSGQGIALATILIVSGKLWVE